MPWFCVVEWSSSFMYFNTLRVMGKEGLPIVKTLNVIKVDR